MSAREFVQQLQRRPGAFAIVFLVGAQVDPLLIEQATARDRPFAGLL